MIDFSYNILFAVIGGALLSLATSFHLYVKGRITGMSGIFFGLISYERKNFHWKISLVCTMIIVSVIFFQIYGDQRIYADPEKDVSFFDSSNKDLNLGGFIVAGIFTGFGTKMGNGCTSGHGLCGLPRFSIRSYVNMTCFILMAVGTATLKFYYPFLEEEYHMGAIERSDLSWAFLAAAIFTLNVFFFYYCLVKRDTEKTSDIIIAFITGGIFALGLLVSGMTKRSKIINFLRMKDDWDPSLLFVLLAGSGLNFLTFNYIIHRAKTPLLCPKLEIPTNKKIDWKLILGGLTFGIGWGLGGICPGPGFTLLPIFYPEVFFLWFGGLTCGQYLAVGVDKIVSGRALKKVQSVSSGNNGSCVNSGGSGNSGKEEQINAK